mmetsp:Transcript_6039/g.16394  ORF Transcript_6039/g.16394 Transcript_6039/m.16394 type:complete len:252 (+) Transcript_6039:378-1133(+)
MLEHSCRVSAHAGLAIYRSHLDLEEVAHLRIDGLAAEHGVECSDKIEWQVGGHLRVGRAVELRPHIEDVLSHNHARAPWRAGLHVEGAQRRHARHVLLHELGWGNDAPAAEAFLRVDEVVKDDCLVAHDWRPGGKECVDGVRHWTRQGRRGSQLFESRGRFECPRRVERSQRCGHDGRELVIGNDVSCGGVATPQVLQALRGGRIGEPCMQRVGRIVALIHAIATPVRELFHEEYVVRKAPMVDAEHVAPV